MKEINNNIEERLVSFESAKLLKKAGFDIRRGLMYGTQNIPQLESYNETLFDLYRDYFLAPTQQVAIDWIRINFGIHIRLDRNWDMWRCEVFRIIGGNKHVPTGWENYDTPEEAKEEALKYCLTELIHGEDGKEN